MAGFLIKCPYCARSSSVDGSLAGRKARCKGCGQTFALTPSAEIGGPLSVSGLPSTLTSEPSPTTLAQAFPLPETIARFVIKQRLGSGAFGTVYRATDPLLGREVALKVPQPGLLQNPSATERFLREARAAAMLRHPNIVTLFETGIDRGEYYIATEFIAGTTLAEAVDPAGIDPRRAAEVVAALAEALQFAHAQGIVHRDVKPANIMLDRQGQPHLMDFGLARFEGASGEKLTQDGAILGTPAYMAPEQAAATGTETSAASDQYSLGVTLYELLTGQTPFSGPPEIVIFNLAHRDPPAPRVLKPEVPPELETICLKAMAKAPTDRYGTCQELAEDLRRWLRDEPIRGRLAGPPQQLGRWLRRNRLAAGLAASVVAGLIMLGAGMAMSRRKPPETPPVAAHDLGAGREAPGPAAVAPVPPGPESDRVTSKPGTEPPKSSEGHGGGSPHPAEPPAASAGEVAASAPADRKDPAPPATTVSTPRPPEPKLTYVQQIRAAYQAVKDGLRERAEALLDGCPAEARSWEWSYCRRLSRFHLTTLSGHSGPVLCVAFSPDGKKLASGGEDRTVLLWDEKGSNHRLLGHHSQPVIRVAFTADGSRIISVGRDSILKEWDASSAQLTRPPVPIVARGLSVIDISPDAKWIAGGTSRGKIHVCETGSGQEDFAAGQDRTKAILGLAFSPDGQRVFSRTSDGWTIHYREAAVLGKRRPRNLGFETKVASIPKNSGNAQKTVNLTFESIAASPDGRHVALATGNTVSLYDLQAGAFLQRIQWHPKGVTTLAFSRDGRWLAADGDDRTIHIWEAANGKWRTSLEGHSKGLTGIRFNQDDTRVAASSDDGNVYVWTVGDGLAEKTVDLGIEKSGEEPERCEGRFSADSKTLSVKQAAGAGRMASLMSWDAESVRPIQKLDGIIGMSPDFSRVASFDSGRITIRDPARQASPRQLGIDGATFRADRAGGSVGTEAVILDENRYGVLIQRNRGDVDANDSVGVWDEKAGAWAWLKRSEGTASSLGAVADHATPGRNSPAPASNHLIYRRDADSIVVVSARDGSVVLSQPGTSYQVCPQGDQVAIFSGGQSDKASIWSLERKKAVTEFAGRGLAFDPSGKKIATWGGQNEGVSIWDTATGEKLYAIASADNAVVFSPDGRRIVGPRGGSLVIRDASTGNEILQLPGLTGTPLFSPDGLRLATIGDRLTVRFADPSGFSPAPPSP